MYEVCSDTVQQKIFIISEFCKDGDLGYFMKKNRKISEEEALKILEQVTDGLKFLNNQGIMHRNLRPENILIARDEFGQTVYKVANYWHYQVMQRRYFSTQTIVTELMPRYVAPEMLHSF